MDNMAKKLTTSIGKKLSFKKTERKPKLKTENSTNPKTITIASDNSFHCEKCGALNEISPQQSTTITEVTIKNLLEHMKQILVSKDKPECEILKQEICKTINDIKTPINIKECGSLLEAAESGNVVNIEEFISSNTDINYQNKLGNSALHISSMHGHLDAVKILLEAGANIKVKNLKLEVALHVAAENGHESIVELFLSKGVFIDIRNIDNNTPLHLATINGKVKVVDLLLAKEANVKVKNNTNKTPYMYANNDNVVAAFVRKIPSITAKKTDKEELLCKSALKGWTQVVDLLIKTNININCYCKNTQDTPLLIAVKNKNIKIVKLLLNKLANINCKDATYNNPIHCATDCEMVKLLHSYNSKLDLKGGVDQNTPLMIAAYYGRTDIIEYLLDNGCDLEMTNKSGWTALHHAASGGFDDAVEILLERGSNIKALDCNGKLPGIIAYEFGHISIIDKFTVRARDSSLCV